MLRKSPARPPSTSYPDGHYRSSSGSSELTLFPIETVDPPWDDPEWDDPDRWEPGPAIPPESVLHPPGCPAGFRFDDPHADGDGDEEPVTHVHPAALARAVAAARIGRQHAGKAGGA